MNGKIYVIENSVNNKLYVGQTTQLVEDRFKQHLKSSNSNSNNKQLIHKAICKHGKENFFC